jgi:hypothetical protein
MYKRGLFRDKSANEHSYWTIVEIVIIILIATVMFQFVKNVSENRFFERSALSKDTALLMDTIQSVPGDLSYTYTHSMIDTTRYDFKFNNFEVYVNDKGGLLNNFYPYYDNENIANTYTSPITLAKKIQFQKTGGDLKIGKELYSKLSKKGCSQKTSPNTIQFIYVVYKGNALEPVAQVIKQYLSLSKKQSSVLSFEEYEKTIKSTQPTQSNTDSGQALLAAVQPTALAPTLIFISEGKETTAQQNLFYVYYNSDESGKVACNIANAYLENSVMESDAIFSKDDGSMIPKESEFSVSIEVPNLKSGVADLRKLSEASASSIVIGIETYEGKSK